MGHSSPVAEVLGTLDQDVHTVAGDEAHHQQTERTHLQAGQTWTRWERGQLSSANAAEDSKVSPSLFGGGDSSMPQYVCGG